MLMRKCQQEYNSGSEELTIVTRYHPSEHVQSDQHFEAYNVQSVSRVIVLAKFRVLFVTMLRVIKCQVFPVDR